MRVLTMMLMLFMAATACAQESGEQPQFVAGEHYDELSSPVYTFSPGKIEVTEFFWYGCGHCYTFEPLINAWSASKPADVALVKSPAMWNGNMQVHAKIFYTAKALKVFDQVHPAIFDAMHKENKKLLKIDEIEPYFIAAGVDAEKFRKTFDSFGVKSQVQQADARARGAKISGTPELIVDGRYLVSGSKAGGQTGMLQVVNFLIEKIRQENQ